MTSPQQPVTDDDIQYIDIAEFRDCGYLQELNRKFLHPLGMAMSVKQNDDGTWVLGGVWDYRDDPEGIYFDPGEDLEDKALAVAEERKARVPARSKALGYWIQPYKEFDECDGRNDCE